MLASNDWRFLALYSIRDSKLAKLYLIDTATDKLSLIDEGDASYSVIGWSGHYLAYQVTRNNVPYWQANRASIKSFNADTRKVNTLASTAAAGTYEYDAQYESFDYALALLGNRLVFTRRWYQYYPGLPSGHQNTLSWVRLDGSGAADLKTADSATTAFGQPTLIKPNQAAYYATSLAQSTTNQATDYFTLSDAGTSTKVESVRGISSPEEAIRYLVSPNGERTFWSEARDGKFTLFSGDKNGDQPKQLAALSEFRTYGWLTNDYLLVSKHNSELYIVPADFSSAPYKVTDYHIPSYGYGGGYGG